MPAKPADLERVEHMIESIKKIFIYTEDLGYDGFYNNELIQDAVIKNFEVIGEVAYHITSELKDNFKDFEDSIQYSSALTIEGIKAIITRNVKDYRNSEIAVMTPSNYLKMKEENEN